jgi:hypothetical protein
MVVLLRTGGIDPAVTPITFHQQAAQNDVYLDE